MKSRFKTNKNNTKQDLEDVALIVAEKLSAKLADGFFVVFDFVENVYFKTKKTGGLFKK
jgi:hypothetical protein